MHPVLATMIGFFKMLTLLVSIYKENKEEKAKIKADLAKEMIDAFAQTDKKTRASRINASINSINTKLHYPKENNDVSNT